MVDNKKRIELHYLEEARLASSLFPQGSAIPHERPDFLLGGTPPVLGLEVTELCRQDPRAEAARLGKVREKARVRYARKPGAYPVDVSAAFWRQAYEMTVDALADGLAGFVHARRDTLGGSGRDLPDGFCHIGVFRPLDPEGPGRWLDFRAFDTVLAPRDLIDARIAEKNRRVADYRAAAPQAWLLIVNDQFLGPGEVYARPQDLAEWTFDFAFRQSASVLAQAGRHCRGIRVAPPLAGRAALDASAPRSSRVRRAVLACRNSRVPNAWAKATNYTGE